HPEGSLYFLFAVRKAELARTPEGHIAAGEAFEKAALTPGLLGVRPLAVKFAFREYCLVCGFDRGELISPAQARRAAALLRSVLELLKGDFAYNWNVYFIVARDSGDLGLAWRILERAEKEKANRFDVEMARMTLLSRMGAYREAEAE